MTFDPNAAAGPDSGIFGLNDTPESARVVLVPVPFEATTSYGGGTSQGPAAILRASRQVDLFDIETGKPYEAGICMLPEPKFPEPGARDPDAVNPISRQVNAWVRDTCVKWLSRGKIVGTVGGDHSISFGAIAAHAERYSGLGVLHFDAHADLRHAYEGFEHSHASIMDNVVRGTKIARLVQVGIRDLCEEEHQAIAGSGGRIVAFYDAELAEARFAGETWAQQCARIVAALPLERELSTEIRGRDLIAGLVTAGPANAARSRSSMSSWMRNALWASSMATAGPSAWSIDPPKAWQVASSRDGRMPLPAREG